MNRYVVIAMGLGMSMAVPTAAQPTGNVKSNFKLAEVQAMLAVQGLDGWLLYDDNRRNPVAFELVNPRRASRAWYYLIPAEGQPVAVIHQNDAAGFRHAPGAKRTYRGARDLKRRLGLLLKGMKNVAMEYAPRSGIPGLTRVDPATAKLVSSLGVSIQSSAQLVQVTKSLWRPQGRISHYVAAHHLEMLKREALAFIAKRLRERKPPTTDDIIGLLRAGYKVRGLEGPSPVVVVNQATANPDAIHRVTKRAALPPSVRLTVGDLVLVWMAGRVDTGPRRIHAETAWLAYAGAKIPERYVKAFNTVVRARDAAIRLIRERFQRRRAVRGYEVDQTVRQVIGKAGLASRFVHRTGHSIDTQLLGDGANLDDYRTHDTRSLVTGSGFSIEPGVYIPGDFGVRVQANVFVGRHGLEVTTVLQNEITALLK